MNYLKLVLLVFFVISFESFGQFTSNYRISGGIITTQIIGDNPGRLSIIDTSPDNVSVTGGSFPDAQPGMQLHFLFPIDENSEFRIPVSLDYTFFRGKERDNYDVNIIDYYSHTLNVFGFNTGFHWAFLPVRFARASVYAGLEVRMSYIHNIDMEWFRDIRDNSFLEDELYLYDEKSDALRLGGIFKLGVEGRLRDNFYINAGGTLGILNIAGKHDSRGELFTPLPMHETRESNVYTLQVFILIQYNL